MRWTLRAELSDTFQFRSQTSRNWPRLHYINKRSAFDDRIDRMLQNHMQAQGAPTDISSTARMTKLLFLRYLSRTPVANRGLQFSLLQLHTAQAVSRCLMASSRLGTALRASQSANSQLSTAGRSIGAADFATAKVWELLLCAFMACFWLGAMNEPLNGNEKMRALVTAILHVLLLYLAVRSHWIRVAARHLFFELSAQLTVWQNVSLFLGCSSFEANSFCNGTDFDSSWDASRGSWLFLSAPLRSGLVLERA